MRWGPELGEDIGCPDRKVKKLLSRPTQTSSPIVANSMALGLFFRMCVCVSLSLSLSLSLFVIYIYMYICA